MVDDTRRQPRSPESVQSVDRAVDLLEALAGFEGPVGVGELAAATGLPQGTAHRLLRSRGVPPGRRRPGLVGAQRAAPARCSPWTGPSGSSRFWLAPKPRWGSARSRR